MVCRVGEAAHPGPHPRIGVANPCCALHKGHLFQDIAIDNTPTVWGLSETHLTTEGISRFRKELKMLSQQWHFTPGAAAPPLTQAVGCVGGKATGVGILSNCPTRSLANNWEPTTWSTARIQACAVRVQQQWIKFGIAYGYAKQCHTRATREATDQVLEHLTERIVFQSKGYRVIGGDLNQDDPDALEQFAIWRQHGFVEIQDLAKQRWNQDIMPTCHQKTRKDHLWISPELIPRLVAVHVDATVFPDHATLVAEFLDFGATPPVRLWRKPLTLPWDQVDHKCLPEECSHIPTTTTDMTAIFQCLETAVDSHLRRSGLPGLLAQQKGRCQTTKPTRARHGIAPNKPSRKHEVQLLYLGEQFVHTKWCRQLRRLQSMSHLMHSETTGIAITTHKAQLWEAIKSAPGFPGGFAHTWKHRSNMTPGAPLSLPRKLPSCETVDAIFHDFTLEFHQLEKALIRARCAKARETRTSNVNAIFRDVAKPRSLPVSTVVTRNNAEVTDVSVDGRTLTYSPPEFDLTEPVNAERGPLVIADHQPGKITLETPQDIEPGETIHQPRLLGDLEDVFQAFIALWEPMWNRHKDADIEQWFPIMEQIRQHVPIPDKPMCIEPITCQQWTKAVQAKKSTSAIGPDGISKNDLLYMPKELTERLVATLNQLERGGGTWPKATMIGLIAAIEKHSAAATPAEYRPITVLSLVYRTYSSIRTRQLLQWLHRFVHQGLKGNMPNQSTTQVWRSLAEQIDHAQYFQYDWSGTVTDICKCFNTLPRHVVYFIGRHLQLPSWFMQSWMRTVSQIQRRFVVCGGCSPPVMSCTGFPEGDPLSVVSMVLINHAMHCIVTQQVSPVSILSYVDNWEAQSSSVQATCDAFQRMLDFAATADIKLDTAKTHFWATTTQARKALKANGHHVVLHAKDLGGHLNYSKRGTNYSLRARIAVTKPMWGWLSRSSAPVAQKLRVLHTVAWPRCLHGVAGVDLGIDHFTTLRASAMHALRWEKHGASSLLTFSLFTAPCNDPGYYATFLTVTQFRQYCISRLAYEVLDHLVTDPPAKVGPGPCGAFLARLHAIHWRWESNGFVRDHQGLQFHMIDCPIQLLRQRLDHAWAASVGHLLSTRAQFGGLGGVDISCSVHTQCKLSQVELGLLRVAMNGSFFTRDKQFSSGKYVSKQCPWCQEEDSVYHRTWECQHFCHERAKLSPVHRKFILAQPECTYLHGWFVETAADLHFRQALANIPDTTQVFDYVGPLPEVLHLFTDGSGLSPQQPALRLTTWSVCLAMLPGDDFQSIAAGGTPGVLQTVLRAEITAAISACQFALQQGRKFYIWTDCQVVFDRLTAFFTQTHKEITCKHKDHDLWQRLQGVFQACCEAQLFEKVLKISSHQDTTQFSDLVDQWAIRGNEAADTMAIHARALLPASVLHAYHNLEKALAERYAACASLHRLFIDIGLKVIQEKEATRAREATAWEQITPAKPVESDEVSFFPLPEVLEIPEIHTLGEGIHLLDQWLRVVTQDPMAQPAWVSSYQLYAHFQMTMDHLGFFYNRKTKVYEELSTVVPPKDYDFIRAAGWFQAMLKCFAKTLNMSCNVQSRMPSGTVLKLAGFVSPESGPFSGQEKEKGDIDCGTSHALPLP
eukprot:s2188_g9.t1